MPGAQQGRGVMASPCSVPVSVPAQGPCAFLSRAVGVAGRRDGGLSGPCGPVPCLSPACPAPKGQGLCSHCPWAVRVSGRSWGCPSPCRSAAHCLALAVQPRVSCSFPASQVRGFLSFKSPVATHDPHPPGQSPSVSSRPPSPQLPALGGLSAYRAHSRGEDVLPGRANERRGA